MTPEEKRVHMKELRKSENAKDKGFPTKDKIIERLAMAVTHCESGDYEKNKAFVVKEVENLLKSQQERYVDEIEDKQIRGTKNKCECDEFFDGLDCAKEIIKKTYGQN